MYYFWGKILIFCEFLDAGIFSFSMPDSFSNSLDRMFELDVSAGNFTLIDWDIHQVKS